MVLNQTIVILFSENDQILNGTVLYIFEAPEAKTNLSLTL
jgi:hypothetical protein